MHKHPHNQSYVGSNGKHSQQMCPCLYVTRKSVTKPMSYVAALHLVPN